MAVIPFSYTTRAMLSILAISLLVLFVFDFPLSSSSSSSLLWMSLRRVTKTAHSHTDSYENYDHPQVQTTALLRSSSSLMKSSESLSATTNLQLSVSSPEKSLSSGTSSTQIRRRRRLLESTVDNAYSNDTPVMSLSRKLTEQDRYDGPDDLTNTTAGNYVATTSSSSKGIGNESNMTSGSNEVTTPSQQQEEGDDNNSLVPFYIVSAFMIFVVLVFNAVEYFRTSSARLLRIQQERERSIREQEAAREANANKLNALILSQDEFNALPLLTLEKYLQLYDAEKSQMKEAQTNNTNSMDSGNEGPNSNIVLDNDEKDSNQMLKQKTNIMGFISASIFSKLVNKRITPVSDNNNNSCNDTSTVPPPPPTTTTPDSIDANLTTKSTRVEEDSAIVDKKSEEDVEAAINDHNNTSATECRSITCSICVEEMDDPNEMVKMLPRCRHVYHTECIQQWLLERQSDFCPICKVTVKDKDVEEKRLLLQQQVLQQQLDSQRPIAPTRRYYPEYYQY